MTQTVGQNDQYGADEGASSSSAETVPEVETATETVPEVETTIETFPEVETTIETFPEVETTIETFPEVETAIETFPEVETATETFPEVETATETLTVVIVIVCLVILLAIVVLLVFMYRRKKKRQVKSSDAVKMSDLETERKEAIYMNEALGSSLNENAGSTFPIYNNDSSTQVERSLNSGANKSETPTSDYCELVEVATERIQRDCEYEQLNNGRNYEPLAVYEQLQ